MACPFVEPLEHSMTFENVCRVCHLHIRQRNGRHRASSVFFWKNVYFLFDYNVFSMLKWHAQLRHYTQLTLQITCRYLSNIWALWKSTLWLFCLLALFFGCFKSMLYKLETRPLWCHIILLCRQPYIFRKVIMQGRFMEQCTAAENLRPNLQISPEKSPSHSTDE